MTRERYLTIALPGYELLIMPVICTRYAANSGNATTVVISCPGNGLRPFAMGLRFGPWMLTYGRSPFRVRSTARILLLRLSIRHGITYANDANERCRISTMRLLWNYILTGQGSPICISSRCTGHLVGLKMSLTMRGLAMKRKKQP